MDILLNHENYKCLREIVDCSVEESVETEFSLPEYMPEILRIIKVTAEPKVNSCRLVGERVTVDGSCDLRVIYTAEDDCIYTFSQKRPFTRHCENTDFTDALDVVSRVSVSYVNSRATGTKRVELKAGLNVRIMAYKADVCDLVHSQTGCGVEEKREPINAMSIGCRKTRQFSMSDTLTLNVPCAFIISANAVAVCSDIKKISNKIMIRGEAVVDICYVNGSDKSNTYKLKHILPINQILEFDGMDEKFTGDVHLCVTALDVMQKNDSDGVCSAFDISLGIDATAVMWEQKELIAVSDAYAVGACVELKKEPVIFCKALDEIKDTFILKDSFKVSGEGVSSICDSVSEILSCDVKYNNGTLMICGSIGVSVLIKDGSGVLSDVNKVLDYCYERKDAYAVESVCCTPHIVITGTDCAVKDRDNIDIRIEMKISGCVFHEYKTDVVTNITEGELTHKRNINAVTVYFPDGEESLWGIARRYNTTVSAIAAENNIEGDTTGGLKMIFIPSV